MEGPRLVLQLADGSQKPFPLLPRTSLGRQPGNDVLLADREVSKAHALIEQAAGGWILRDLGSSNGSFVNGVRVQETTLRHGDELTLGASRLRVVLSAGETRSRAGVTVFHAGAEAAAILHALSREEAAGFAPEAQIADPAVLRRDYEKLRIANEFSRQIVLEQDEEELLGKILAFAFEVLPAERGAILLVERETGELVPRASRHRSGEAQEELALSGSILRRVLETRESALISDAGTDARFASSRSIVLQGIRSAMAVPLLWNEEVRGVLWLDSRQVVAAFSEKDLQLLSGIAAQASLALERTALTRRIEREAETRAHLSRFLSPALLEQASAGRLVLQKGGQLTWTTILFSDIRGFTPISERVGPEETVRMLNEYFERMVDCVFRHGGVLDKFIGDAIMALWGAPVQREDDADRAVACALEMRDELAALNAHRIADGRQAIEIGIGINAGLAVVGNMGSSKRLEYTAIGDAVNVASRLCGMAGPGEIVVSMETIARSSGFRTEALPPTAVKGKSLPVELCRVLGRSSGHLPRTISRDA